MKKKLSLFLVTFLAVFASSFAEPVEKDVIYALAEGDAFTSGQTVEVKNGTDVVATITYGEDGGEAFKAAKADKNIEGFTAFTEGNGTNGNKTGGTWYTITPKFDGTIEVAVALNADKAFYILENGTALADYDGITVSAKYYGTYKFTAKADKSYKIYCAGSKLGFYGFKYNYAVEEDEPSPAETNYYVVGSMNQWTASENYQLVAIPGAEGEYMFTGDFEANTEIKVTSSEGAWYPDGQDNNYVIQEAGNYTIYFRPAGNVPDWYGGFFNVVMKEEPIVENDYTVQFVNGAKWDKVYAYAWAGEGEQATLFLGDFPGEEMGLIDTQVEIDGVNYPVYEKKFKVAGEPEKILFNNGSSGEGNQTEDLVFENNKQYQLIVKDEPQPEETSYTIKFKDAGEGKGDGSAAQTEIANLIAEGADYVKATTATKAYNGKEGYGVKLSSGSANGSMTLTLAQSVKPTKITYKASAWVNSQGVQDVSSISINGKDAQSLTTDLTEYTVNYDGETEVSEIAIAATKRAYITELTVTYVDESGGDQPQTVYSVAGSSEALFGTTWNQKEGNEMTLTEGKYTWTKEKVAVPAGDVKFKVVKNHSWDESWPEEDYVLNIPETAEYTVTITFDEETKTVAAEATKTGEAQVDDVVVLAGVEAICGSSWNDKDEANKMTESPTAVGLYTITKENLTLNAGTYEYKVVLNGTWYPERDNATVVIENAGIYSIEFTFNKETKETNAIATKTGDPADEKDFSVSFTTDKAWEKVYAYVWKANIQAPVEWPGVEITDTKDGDTYYYAFQSTYAPDFIIFNNGTEAEVKEQTADLPFVDGMIYSLTTEKTTAWAGDPDEAIPATTGIEISATTCKDAGVQAEKIIRIVAKELAIAAPARAFDNAATALDAGDISVLKGKVDEPLVADELLNYSEGVYEFTATAEIAAEMKENGFRIKPKNDKQIAITSIEVKKAPEPTTFAEKVAAALEAGTGEVTVTMDQDETLDAAINVPLGKQLVLDGANKTLTLGAETNFVLNDNITLKNVKIDATELTKPLIALTADPAEGTKKNQDVYADAAAQDFNLLNAVTVEGAMVKNLKTQFISSNGTDWALENFTLTKSIIQLDATGKNFIAFDATKNNKGAIKNITISENTIYNINETSNAYFIRFANASNAQKAFGIANNTSTFDYKLTKNTIINTFKAQNFGNNTPNNAKTTIEATQNIYVDLKQPSKFIQGNCTKTVEKNVSWGGTEETTMSEHIDPAFTVPTTALDLTAENGGIDLKIDALSKAAEYQSGDPRWLVPAMSYYLVGNMTEWKPVAEYKLTANTAAEGVEYMITVDLAADAQFKIAKSDGTTIADTDWYPQGMGNNYGENGELQGAGKYTVYFRPNADGGDDWFYHVIYAQKLYTITVENCEGMTITPEATEVAAGTKVWATVAMTEGYEPEFPGFTNTDTGEVIEMTEGTDVGMDKETGKVWIIMPAQNLTITAKAAKVSKITLDLSQENGSATCISVNAEDPTTFYKGEGKEIYLNVQPGAGYTADITVTAGEDPVEVIAEAGTYHDQPYTHKFIMPAKDVTVKVTFTKSTGINGIDADDADDNAPIYNLAGQKVTKAYKGVVIQNGKKYMQK